MADIRNMVSFEKILQQATRVVADKVFQESQLNIVNMGIIDTGHLLKSGILIPTPLGATINYSAPYAWYVEKGRLPGSMPPVEALEKWVRRKMGIASKDARRVAWAVAMKIKQNGTQPQPFLESALLKVSKMRFKLQVET